MKRTASLIACLFLGLGLAACNDSGDTSVDPSCADEVRNQDETDVDCGGPCSPCAEGKGCEQDADCQSGYCLEDVCSISDDDLCPDDPDKTAPGICGCGVAESPDCLGQLVIDHTHTELAQIPSSAIEQAKANLHIAYQHTSHGSQLITGLNALEAFPEYDGLYAWDDAGAEPGALDLDDLGIPGCADLSQGDSIDEHGVTPWVTATRALLDNPANDHINVVLWSWCSINGHDAQRYVDNMEILIEEYPDVIFVFMTGHSEGQGEDLSENSVHYNNQLIRAHCAEHKRWLFDFADIEAHDPDGGYFWDLSMYDNLDYDGGNWAVEWIAANPDNELAQLTTGQGVTGYDGCSGCAHSDSPAEANLNCVLKGRAAWHLFARLAGWSGE